MILTIIAFATTVATALITWAYQDTEDRQW